MTRLIIFLLLIGTLTACSVNKSLVNSDKTNFFPFKDQREIKMIYLNSDSYVKYIYTGEKEIINGKEYYKRLSNYSWNKIETHYFREENGNNYYYDLTSKTESLNIPREIKTGYSWKSNDEAWAYEITNTKAKLTTPEKTYRNLVVIKATQLQNRDKDKSQEYFNYYQIGVGHIASLTNGRIMNYKSEAK
ncbi:hypothetical protein ACFCT7_00230 [Fulvivirgaceae bacterium LMO-SS25]